MSCGSTTFDQRLRRAVPSMRPWHQSCTAEISIFGTLKPQNASPMTGALSGIYGIGKFVARHICVAKTTNCHQMRFWHGEIILRHVSLFSDFTRCESHDGPAGVVRQTETERGEILVLYSWIIKSSEPSSIIHEVRIWAAHCTVQPIYCQDVCRCYLLCR